MSEIAIISSGNAEKDAEDLKQAQIHDQRIHQGICPNGCAILEWETEYNASCFSCGFHYSTNVSFGLREAKEGLN